MSRIGVFTCWCGENIARTVDVDEVAKQVGELPGVVCSLNYKYMCSDPGQSMVREKIASEHLDGIVVASCSPHMHLKTFRKAAQTAGLNPYLVEMANVREHCSWVHHDRPAATRKAIDIIRMSVQKVRNDRALAPISVPVTRRAMVIGGGVAGIQAALDIADAGYEVVMVEREPSIGGKMAGLSETFPTLDCSQCILTPRMVEVGQHPRIKLYSYSEVDSVEGFIGNFKIRIRQKPRYVDISKCTGCGDCWTKCPIKKNPSEFDFGMGNRPAIFIPFPQAVPARPVIDQINCTRLKRGKGCEICAKNCKAGAIDFNDQEKFVEESVGAVVVATGYTLYSIGKQQTKASLSGYGEYGYGKYKDVIDSLQFERLVSASGPTGGVLKRPSDGAIPKSVVFVACVGSRDNAKGVAYCSKICCMYTAKHTMLYKHKVHDGQAHVFYMDIRSGGKGYDEFVRRAIEQDGANYYRGRVSKITEENGKLLVRGADTLSGLPITVEADLVVLASAMRPARRNRGAGAEVERGLRRVRLPDGIAPQAAAGGDQRRRRLHCRRRACAQGYPGISGPGFGGGEQGADHAGGRSSDREPEIAGVNEQTCAACFACARACPYHAIDHAEVRTGRGVFIKHTARVNPGLCMGCGTCVSVCPSKSIELQGFTEQQIYAMVESMA